MPDNININIALIVFRLLTDPKGWREDSIRRELDIADRTYRKYRKILQEFEPFQGEDGETLIIEVEDGEARYLRLKDRSFSNRERKTVTSQFAALNFAQQLIALLGDTNLGSATDVFIKTFRAQMRKSPYDLQELMRNVDRMFFQLPDAPKDYSKKSDVLEEIVECIVFRVPVNIQYSSASFDNLSLDIKPFTLAMYRSALYLVAQGADEEVRIYAVDRISKVTRLKEKPFEYPSKEVYDPREYTEGSFGIYRSDSKKVTKFELVFSAEKWLQLYVSERRWHPSQNFTSMRDGRLRMTFEVNTEVEVWPWIRQFGDQVEVIKPKRSGPLENTASKIEKSEAPLIEVAKAEEPAPARRTSTRKPKPAPEAATKTASKAKPAAKTASKAKPAAKTASKAKPAAKAASKAKPAAKTASKAKPAAKTSTKPAGNATVTTKPAAKTTSKAKITTKAKAKAKAKPAKPAKK